MEEGGTREAKEKEGLPKQVPPGGQLQPFSMIPKKLEKALPSLATEMVVWRLAYPGMARKN
jgi:hypothetical protein